MRFRAVVIGLVSVCAASAAVPRMPVDSLPDTRHRSAIWMSVHGGKVVPTNGFTRGESSLGYVGAMGGLSAAYTVSYGADHRLGRLYPYAWQGIGAGVLTYFNNREIGVPYGIWLVQGSRIAAISPRLSLDYEWNFGLITGWKKCDPETNPRNWTIGARTNAFMHGTVMLTWRLSAHWSVFAGFDAIHCSNGNTSFPNSGMNSTGARLGMTYRPSGRSRRLLTVYTGTDSIPARWEYDIMLYGAPRKRVGYIDGNEAALPGSYAAMGFNAAVMRRFNKYLAAGLSLDAQYYSGANARGYGFRESYDNPAQAPRHPRWCSFADGIDIGVSARAEFSMPVFTIGVGLGHDLLCPDRFIRGFYQILALKAFVTEHFYLHAGYSLTDFSAPRNLMLGVGVRMF